MVDYWLVSSLLTTVLAFTVALVIGLRQGDESARPLPWWACATIYWGCFWAGIVGTLVTLALADYLIHG